MGVGGDEVGEDEEDSSGMEITGVEVGEDEEDNSGTKVLGVEVGSTVPHSPFVLTHSPFSI